MAKLAFYTFGVLYEAIPHPQVQGFVDRLTAVWASAESVPGFVDRSRRDAPWGEIVSPRFYDPDQHPAVPDGSPPNFAAPATLSLWESVQAVRDFAYAGPHLEALQKRREWFRHPEWPTYVAWWVADGETPTWTDAYNRLEHLHDHGPTPAAFNFRQAFDAAGMPLSE